MMQLLWKELSVVYMKALVKGQQAGHFERQPFHAALICISKLYSGMFDDKIDRFVCIWETVFNYSDENQEYTIEQYIMELRELILILK